MKKRNDRKQKRRIEALERMESYRYENSRAKRLGTMSEKHWHSANQRAMDKLALNEKPHPMEGEESWYAPQDPGHSRAMRWGGVK